MRVLGRLQSQSLSRLLCGPNRNAAYCSKAQLNVRCMEYTTMSIISAWPDVDPGFFDGLLRKGLQEDRACHESFARSG